MSEEVVATDTKQKTKKYVVGDAAIFVDIGDGNAARFDPGEVVDLTAAFARHFIAAKAIFPHVED